MSELFRLRHQQEQAEKMYTYPLTSRPPPLLPTDVRPRNNGASFTNHQNTPSPDRFVAHRQVTHLDPDVLRYVQKARKGDILEIERSCDVIVTSSRAGILDVYDKVASESDSTTRSSIGRACASLLRLYEDSRASLARNPDDRINVKTLSASVKDVSDVIDTVNSRRQGVWIKDSLDNYNAVFFGTISEVTKAKEEFIQMLTQEGGTQNPVSETRRSTVFELSYPVDTVAINSQLHAFKTKRNDTFAPWEGTLDGITLKIYQSDLTHENVDVIVSAIGSDYQLQTSLAKQIARNAGGAVLYDLNNTAQRHGQRNLPAKTVTFTDGGKLACRHVIFVVLPRFSDQSPLKSREVLFGCFVHVLDIANRYMNVKSIAMATLGTGVVHGFQTIAFAQTLLAAINAFSSETNGRRNIREIRLVDRQQAKLNQLIDVFQPYAHPPAFGHSSGKNSREWNGKSNVSRESSHYILPVKQMDIIGGTTDSPISVTPVQSNLKLDKNLNEDLIARQIEAQKSIQSPSSRNKPWRKKADLERTPRTSHPATAPAVMGSGESRPRKDSAKGTPNRDKTPQPSRHSSQSNQPRLSVEEPIEKDERTQTPGSQQNGDGDSTAPRTADGKSWRAGSRQSKSGGAVADQKDGGGDGTSHQDDADNDQQLVGDDPPNSARVSDQQNGGDGSPIPEENKDRQNSNGDLNKSRDKVDPNNSNGQNQEES